MIKKLRKPLKPRKPIEPTIDSMKANVRRHKLVTITGPLTLEKILDQIPKNCRDPHHVRLVQPRQTHFGYGDSRGDRYSIRIEYAADDKTLQSEYEKRLESYKRNMPKFEERWEAYEKKLMEWKEWKYAKVMKEINEA